MIWHLTSIYTKSTLSLFLTVFYHECSHWPQPWVVSKNWPSKVRPAGSLRAAEHWAGFPKASKCIFLMIEQIWAETSCTFLIVLSKIGKILARNSYVFKYVLNSENQLVQTPASGIHSKTGPSLSDVNWKRTDWGTLPIKFAGDWPSKLFRSTVI